jgi:hypothetical protein
VICPDWIVFGQAEGRPFKTFNSIQWGSNPPHNLYGRERIKNQNAFYRTKKQYSALQTLYCLTLTIILEESLE